jgi:hypothetical protein
MKKFFLLMVLNVMINIVHAQSSIIKITGTKFPFEIMRQWINAYSKTHPGIEFQLSKSIPPDSADLMIAAHAFIPGELNEDAVVIALNRYAQLPIVNSKRGDLKALQQKGFTREDLKNVYFNTDT